MLKVLKTIGFWIASYTWGIIMTLIGSFAAIGLLVSGHKPYVVGLSICFSCGRNWGGVSFGPFILVQEGFNTDLLYHEAGHSLQNIVWGPLFPVVIALPSMTRYWARKSKRIEDRFSYLGAVLILVLISVAIPSMVLGLTLKSTFILVFSVAWVFYTIGLFFWQLKEIRGYMEVGKDKPYDSVWFEKQATELGKILYYNW